MKWWHPFHSISNMTGSPLSFFLKLFPFQCFQKLSWRALCRILTFIRVRCSQFDHSLPLPLTQKFLHPQISESFVFKSPLYPLSRQWKFCWSRTWAKDSAYLSMIKPLSYSHFWVKPIFQVARRSRIHKGRAMAGSFLGEPLSVLLLKATEQPATGGQPWHQSILVLFCE